MTEKSPCPYCKALVPGEDAGTAARDRDLGLHTVRLAGHHGGNDEAKPWCNGSGAWVTVRAGQTTTPLG